MINEIFFEDALITMSRMPDKSIDHVITSPPYNLGKDTSHSLSESKYSDNGDNMTQDDFFEWQKNIITELLRVTKKHIFYNIQLLKNNKSALFRLIGHFHENIKEVVIWDKGFGEPAMGAGVLNSVFEFIIIFSNDEPSKRTFHNVDWRGTVDNVIRNKKYYNKISQAHYDEGHSAVMPLNLARRIIDIWVKENETVYDPFSGTGTTAVACVKHNVNYIGSEIKKEFFELSVKNVNNAKSQPYLFPIQEANEQQ